MRAAPPAPATLLSSWSSSHTSMPRLHLLFSLHAPAAAACRAAPVPGVPHSVSVSVRRLILLRHGENSAGCCFARDHDRPPSKSGRAHSIRFSDEQMGRIPEFVLCRHQVKTTRWRPIYALETGGSPSPDGQDFDDNGFLGRTRLGRLIQAAARELLEKFNSARTNSPTKIFLVLLGFYTANALATILGQTGDWDVLVAGVVVAAIEGIGMLMYRKPAPRPPGRFRSLISMINYWKAGVCLGLFVDAFKLGS